MSVFHEPLQFSWRSLTRRFYLRLTDLQMSCRDYIIGWQNSSTRNCCRSTFLITHTHDCPSASEVDTNQLIADNFTDKKAKQNKSCSYSVEYTAHGVLGNIRKSTYTSKAKTWPFEVPNDLARFNRHFLWCLTKNNVVSQNLAIAWCPFKPHVRYSAWGVTWNGARSLCGPPLESGGHLNINMSSYQYRDPHVKDKTVSPTVLSLTWESPYQGKTVFILRRGPDGCWLLSWQALVLPES